MNKLTSQEIDVKIILKYVRFDSRSKAVVARKGCGSFCSPKSYNLCLKCLQLPRVKICHSGKRGPENETLNKGKEQTAFYDRFQPSAGPGNNQDQEIIKVRE